jgi:hypothetical protein
MTVTREATELVQKLRDCPWCGAKKGEECNVQQKNPGFVPKVHVGRMPTNISPEEYVKRDKE